VTHAIVEMDERTRWFAGVAGALMLLVGLLCFNYAKMGGSERHHQFAPLGAGLIGFAVGRKLNRL
jgi:hypothetical protein